MSPAPTPRSILAALFPYLKVAAAYARQIQSRIAAQPEKEADSLFGAALSDADLSIQTLVEVALLGLFPEIRFYGEEYEKTYNTKYFRSIELGGPDDYLITLDPIDGTQFYLDGHPNYQIILAILNQDEYEAVLAITPALGIYCYALRGQGCWEGTLEEGLEAAKPLQIPAANLETPKVLLGWNMGFVAAGLPERYKVFDVAIDYSKTIQIPNVNGMLNGALDGAVIRAGKFIDGAALAFVAQEAGCMVTTHQGEALPPLSACLNYERPGLVIANSAAIHQDLLAALRSVSAHS